jgi:sodium-dependent dicarboxylate transporter 2/3/5
VLSVASFRPLPLVLGLAVAGSLLLLDSPLGDAGDGAVLAAAVTLLMAFWWISEAAPIWLTALLPLAVYPFSAVFGVNFDERLLGALLPYVDPYIFLFLGGMGIAAAMQQWNLHRRIALSIMRRVGAAPARLLLGVLAATAFVSMWISNTATAAMMLPIGLALVRELEGQAGKRLAGYGCATMLAIAYGANVGGMGTKIGTVPNAQLSGFLLQERGIDLSFLQFMQFGLPFIVAFVPVLWLALWRIARADAPPAALARAALQSEGARLGGMSGGEKIVLAVFLATAGLWLAGKPLADALRPHVTAFTLAASHVEAAIAMSAAAVLMLTRWRGTRVLLPGALRDLQWDALLLIGGGFSMAAAIDASGLSAWLGAQLAGLRDLPAMLQVTAACLATVTLSAFASNAATTAVMLPILAGSVAPAQANTTLVAAALASSCDFALPAGTPPNAIVFGSGYVRVPVMARTGAVLDVLAAMLVAVWCYWAVPRVLAGS